LLRARSRIWREDSGGSVPKNKVLWVPKNKVLWVLDTEASGRDFELPNAGAWRGLRDG